MRFFLATFFIALLSYFVQSIGPWWMGVVIAAIVAVVAGLRPALAFLSGFIGLAIAWGIAAGWMDFQNHGVLATRMGALFNNIPGSSLLILTILIGAVTGGLGALSAAYGRLWVVRSPRSSQAT
jgi:hypothetical protein